MPVVQKKDPRIKEVVSGKTGHRESVQVFYDPAVISINEILSNYWWQIEELDESGKYDKPIVTLVLPFSTFYPAEDYHQDFYKKSSEYYQKYMKRSGREDYIKAMEEKYGQ